MTSTPADPVRVAVRTPDRHLDVALPADVPLSSLLPTLLRHGGTGLADRGAARGGWVLRRLDGTALNTATTLPDQGVRDGDVLSLGFADESWGELAYDDVVATVAAASGRGAAWGASSRVAAGGWACGVLGALGLVATWRDARTAVVAGVAALALGAAAVLVRRTSTAASALATIAAGYAAAAVLAGGHPSAARAGIASGVALFVGLVALAVLGPRAPALIAGVVVAFLGALAAGLDATWALGADATAAAVLSLAVLLGAGVPIIAARLAGVVTPSAPRVPAHLVAPGTLPPVDSVQLYAAVARADAIILGLHAGVAVGLGAASVALVLGGGPLGAPLAGVAGAATALRGRAYAGRAHRSAIYVGGALALVPALGYAAAHAPVLSLLAMSAAAVIIGLAAGSTPDSPALTRLADVVEIACTAAVVPLACAVTGLFGLVHRLS